MDHPRSRGVYVDGALHAGASEGSSPLARGLRVDKKPAEAAPGIIPARAGFTGAGSPRPGPSPDHPRSRGVYRSSPGPGRVIPGSSPLARGLRDIKRRCGPLRQDHPRSRGVYRTAKVPTPWSGGSSPLARGLRLFESGEAKSSRIIPARAGFTGGSSRGITRSWDHPRSRGVYPSCVRRSTIGRGSSPLARGLHAHSRIGRDRDRIIPARAGFTADDPVAVLSSGDHPRSRGVYE